MSGSKLTIPIGIQTALSIDGTTGGIGLTAPTGKVPNGAVITVYTAPVRFWVNGTAPTATTGHRAEPYQVIRLEDAGEIANFKAIRESSVSATVEVTYFA